MAEEDGHPDSENGNSSLGLGEFTWALLDSGGGRQLLASKLRIPWHSTASLARHRLVARFDAGFGKPLTLISAPPGHGRTTVTSEWGTRTDRHVAWLALDAGDNDLLRFWAYGGGDGRQTREGPASRVVPSNVEVQAGGIPSLEARGSREDVRTAGEAHALVSTSAITPHRGGRRFDQVGVLDDG